MFTDCGVSKPWKFVRGDEHVSVTGLCRWHSNNGHCLLAAARDSLGLAYLPDYYVVEDIASGRLVRVLEEWGGIERDVVAIYQHRRHLSAKVKLFADFLEKRFGQRRPGEAARRRSYCPSASFFIASSAPSKRILRIARSASFAALSALSDTSSMSV